MCVSDVYPDNSSSLLDSNQHICHVTVSIMIYDNIHIHVATASSSTIRKNTGMAGRPAYPLQKISCGSQGGGRGREGRGRSLVQYLPPTMLNVIHSIMLIWHEEARAYNQWLQSLSLTHLITDNCQYSLMASRGCSSTKVHQRDGASGVTGEDVNPSLPEMEYRCFNYRSVHTDIVKPLSEETNVWAHHPIQTGVIPRSQS